MAQDSAGRLAGSGDITDEFHQGRIAVGRSGRAALDRIDYRGRSEMANQNFARVLMHIARGGAHLFVRIRGDIFHEEIQHASFALQHSEKLQGPVGGFDLGRWGFGRGFRRGRGFGREAELGDQVRRQLAPEQKREEGAESQQDAVQSRDSSKRSG